MATEILTYGRKKERGKLIEYFIEGSRAHFVIAMYSMVSSGKRAFCAPKLQFLDGHHRSPEHELYRPVRRLFFHREFIDDDFKSLRKSWAKVSTKHVSDLDQLEVLGCRVLL